MKLRAEPCMPGPKPDTGSPSNERAPFNRTPRQQQGDLWFGADFSMRSTGENAAEDALSWRQAQGESDRQSKRGDCSSSRACIAAGRRCRCVVMCHLSADRCQQRGPFASWLACDVKAVAQPGASTTRQKNLLPFSISGSSWCQICAYNGPEGSTRWPKRARAFFVEHTV